MGEAQQLFDVKQKHLVGKMIFTSKSCASVSNMEFPESKNVFTISAKDIPQNRIMLNEDNFFPVLADFKSDYEGQCLLGVFGPDWASVDNFINNLKISYGESEEKEPETVYTRQFKEGRAVGGQYESAVSEFHIERFSIPIFGDQRIFVCPNEKGLDIEVASEDEKFTRSAIAFSTGLEEKNISLHSCEYETFSNELFMYPSIACIVASVAALKTESPVEFAMPMLTMYPSVTLRLESKLGKDYRLVSQVATVVADLGAFPICTEELASSVAAGMTPPYKLDFVQTDVVIKKSSNAPSFVSPGMGFSIAVAAEENHCNNLIRKTGERLSVWRNKKTNLDELVNSVVQISRFDRQDSSNLQSGLIKGTVSPLPSYSRGIALSCGKTTGVDASMVLSLHVDNITLTPVIDRVWALINMTGSFNQKEEQNRLRHIINLTISRLCPSAEGHQDTDIEITKNDGSMKVSSESLVRGLTISCFASALSQALSHNIKKLPMSEQDIISTLEKSKHVKEEKNETDNEH